MGRIPGNVRSKPVVLQSSVCCSPIAAVSWPQEGWLAARKTNAHVLMKCDVDCLAVHVRNPDLRTLVIILVTVQTPPHFLPSENEQSMSYGPNVPKVAGGSERLLILSPARGTAVPAFCSARDSAAAVLAFALITALRLGDLIKLERTIFREGDSGLHLRRLS